MAKPNANAAPEIIQLAPNGGESDRVTLRFGDAVRGKGASHIFEFDFPDPAKERGEPAPGGIVHNPPHFFSFTHYLKVEGHSGAVTWDTILDEVKENSWAAELYEAIRKEIEEEASDELLHDVPHTDIADDLAPGEKTRIHHMWWGAEVGRSGGGQILESSLLMHLWLLTRDSFETDLAEALVGDGSLNITSVNLVGGLTGSVGAAALLVYPHYLQEKNISTTIYGAVSHLESLQLKGVVPDYVVRRIFVMQRLIPELVILLGQPRHNEKEISIFDALASGSVANYTRARFSNVKTVANRLLTATAMINYYFAYDGELIDRWIAVLIGRAHNVTAEYAEEVLLRGLKGRTLSYSRLPDEKGRYKIKVKNRRAMKLESLEELIPVLLYLRYNPLTITIVEERRFRSDAVHKVNLFGATLIDEILEKLGTSLVDLTSNGTRVVALSAFEWWVINNYSNYTEEQLDKYLANTENWARLVWQFGNSFIGNEVGVDTKLFTHTDGSCIVVGQPALKPHELAIRVAASVSEEIEDPFEGELLARADAKDRKAREERVNEFKAQGDSKKRGKKNTK